MSLDIVIPAHNEEQRIDRTLRAYRTGFPQADVRFLVALDGCDDHTSDIVRAHAAADDRVVLHQSRSSARAACSWRRSVAATPSSSPSSTPTARPRPPSWPA